jgi:hypothetical protein
VIPFGFITESRTEAPRTTDAQVEQDLILSRAVVSIFKQTEVAGALAFRGGNALYKLHLRPPPPGIRKTSTSCKRRRDRSATCWTRSAPKSSPLG